MYQIYVNDDTLIYDSTIEDYKIAKGVIDLEIDKSGTFTFSVYPDHWYYYLFVPMKTVITVYKSGRIVFRGRVINEVTDYWNNKVLTCEGELGFLQDTFVRPYEFQGAPADLLRQFITAHNSQTHDSGRVFTIGTIDIDDANDYVNRSSTDYATTLAMMQSALTGSDLGGHFYITHGDDGTDPFPTLHYLRDFPNTSTQAIEFGVNLKDYTKTVNAEDIATVIIPLGAVNSTTGERLTIESVTGGDDFIFDGDAAQQYGWILKPVIWDDVTLANHLLTKAEAYLADVVKQHISIELNAIDLHLLDRSIASFNVGEYVRVISEPHHLDEVMLCNRQTMDLLQPENDTIVLGYATTSLTGASTEMAASVSTLGKQVSSIRQDATAIELRVEEVSKESKEYTDEQTGEVSKALTEELKKYSTFEQTATSISTAVSETKAYADKKAAAEARAAFSDSMYYTDEQVIDALIDSKGYTNDQLTKYSTIEQTAEAITAAVADVEKGLETTLHLSADGLSITDAEGNSVTISGSQIDADTLNVNAANISGQLTADQIDASELKVDAANITGTLTADQVNLTGAISFSDLTDSEDIQDEIDAATEAAGGAAEAATAASNAVKAWCYSDTTYIDGSKIMTGTVQASMLAGGAVALLNYYGSTVGYLTMDGSYTANINVALASVGSLRLTADYGDVYIRNGGNHFIQLSQSMGRIIVGAGNLAPNYSGGYSCGVAGAVWKDVYAANATIQTSDLRVKKDVTYGLDDYEALFDALQPISFRFVNGTSGRVHLGMGAQDVEQAMTDSGLTDMDFAGLIKSPKTDDKGRVVEGEYDYALRYGEFIPLLVEQVQKLKQRVRALEGTT